jgi:DNA-directed RNA polymerase specialized sigma24 family protein
MGCRIQETQDVEDIVSEVILKILDRLRRLKELPNETAIGDFIGYVNVAAHNACNSYLRARYPNRVRFKSRLRYALTHRADFAIWEGVDGRWICGFSQWREQRRPVNCDWINQARMHPERVIRHGEADDLIDLIRAAFISAQAPIPMEDLVEVAAKILKIADDATSLDVVVEQTGFSNLAAAPIDPAEAASQRLYLKRLWIEIQQLPLSQRIALLLSVRDGTRTSITVLLSEIKIASIREIAQAVGMSASEFVRVLQELPLDDNAISKRLGVSRQQVISYRLSARRRLDRRMKSVD